MLIAVTVMPIVFDMLPQVPDGAAAPVSAAVTMIVTVAVTLRATGVWRLWAPVIGIVSGCLVAAAFGNLRHPAHRGSGLDRAAGGRLARTRSQLRRDVLVPPAGVHLRDPDPGHRDHRRQRRHSTRVVAEAAGSRLPLGAGGGGRGRAGQPAVRPRGDGAEHDLLVEHRGGRDHRCGGPPRRRVHRRRLRLPGVHAQVHGAHPRDPGSRGLGDIPSCCSRSCSCSA